MKNMLNKIKIDPCTYILMLFALISGYIKITFIIFFIVIIHEIGHITFFLLFKIPIEKINIYPFGGLTIVNKKIHERIYKDIIISLGGIIFQLIIYLLMNILSKTNLLNITTYELFKEYNMYIIVFNLIPIIPLDGSKLLNTILNKYLSYKTSYIITSIISFISLIIFIIYNTFYKINDIVIYIFFIIQIIAYIKSYKYTINKFYLERTMYDHYYDKIINKCKSLDKLKINKYYYFYDSKKYINERNFIKKNYFNKK